MQEFSSVIASSYDADSLAPMLTDKAREGWTVVSIVAAGTNVVAYLSRDADADAGDSGATDSADSASATDDAADAPTETLTSTTTAASTTAAAVVEEPAGWGAVDEGPAAMESASPETRTDDADTGDDVATAVTGAAALSDLSTGDAPAPTDDETTNAPAEPASTDASADDTPAGTEPDAAPESAAAEEEAAPAGDEQAAADAPADAGVPAGWYADPSGRYELRYWDGTGWTEHVSRAGQQYTDPPVA